MTSEGLETISPCLLTLTTDAYFMKRPRILIAGTLVSIVMAGCDGGGIQEGPPTTPTTAESAQPDSFKNEMRKNAEKMKNKKSSRPKAPAPPRSRYFRRGIFAPSAGWRLAAIRWVHEADLGSSQPDLRSAQRGTALTRRIWAKSPPHPTQACGRWTVSNPLRKQSLSPHLATENPEESGIVIVLRSFLRSWSALEPWKNREQSRRPRSGPPAVARSARRPLRRMIESALGWIWGIALTAGVVAGLISWVGGEIAQNTYKPQTFPTVVPGGAIEMRPTASCTNVAEFKNGILIFAILGGITGLSMGLSGGLVGQSPYRGMVVGFGALVSGILSVP